MNLASPGCISIPHAQLIKEPLELSPTSSIVTIPPSPIFSPTLSMATLETSPEQFPNPEDVEVDEDGFIIEGERQEIFIGDEPHMVDLGLFYPTSHIRRQDSEIIQVYFYPQRWKVRVIIA